MKSAWPLESTGANVGYVGPFTFWHNNQPKPFNPDYDPKAKARYAKVTESMEKDGFYDNHTRQECAAEWRKRYDELKEKGE